MNEMKSPIPIQKPDEREKKNDLLEPIYQIPKEWEKMKPKVSGLSSGIMDSSLEQNMLDCSPEKPIFNVRTVSPKAKLNNKQGFTLTNIRVKSPAGRQVESAQQGHPWQPSGLNKSTISKYPPSPAKPRANEPLMLNDTHSSLSSMESPKNRKKPTVKQTKDELKKSIISGDFFGDDGLHFSKKKKKKKLIF